MVITWERKIEKLMETGDVIVKERLKLPIGVESFEEIRTDGFYYVDKTKKEIFN